MNFAAVELQSFFFLPFFFSAEKSGCFHSAIEIFGKGCARSTTTMTTRCWTNKNRCKKCGSMRACVCVLCGLWMRPRRTKDVVERRAVCRLISFYCTTLVHSMCRGVKLTDAILKIKDEEKCAEFVLSVPSHLRSLRWISRHDLPSENYDIVDVSDGPRIRKEKTAIVCVCEYRSLCKMLKWTCDLFKWNINSIHDHGRHISFIRRVYIQIHSQSRVDTRDYD